MQRQRDETSGFNYKTGKVLGALSGNALSKLADNVEKVRKTPRYIEKHVRELIEIEMGEITEEGISYDDYKDLYDEKFSHSFPINDLGFNGMDDFFLNGLDGIVDLKLKGYDWLIVPPGTRQSKVTNSSNKEEWEKVKGNVRKLLKIFPYGISINDLQASYKADYGEISFCQLKCKNMKELCLMLPDVCHLDHHIEEGFGWLENGKEGARVYQTVEEMSKYVTFSSSCVKKSIKVDQVLKSIVMKKILLQMRIK